MFKKILLKVSAFAMACTLIGTGAAYTNSTADKTGKSFGIEADAASEWIIDDAIATWMLIGISKKVDFEYWTSTYGWLPRNIRWSSDVKVYKSTKFKYLMIVYPKSKVYYCHGVRNLKINGKSVTL